jgi:membrane protease YdiL (CAAX protease family)
MFERLRMGLRSSPILSYFLLAYALSWSVELLLIANYNSLISVPPYLHYLASFGPCLAGITMTYIKGGKPGLVDLWQRVTRWQVGWKWFLLGALSPVLLAFLSALITYLLSGSLADLSTLGQVEYLGDIGAGAALLLWIVTFGFGEEIGWRGFALPTLQKNHSFLISTLVIGLVWALWHLPAFFYKPQMMALGPGGFIGFSLGVISGSIVLGWLYNRSGGSVFVVGIWHALFDFFTTSSSFHGMTTAIMSTAVMVLAVVIVVFEVTGRRTQKRGLLPLPYVHPTQP